MIRDVNGPPRLSKSFASPACVLAGTGKRSMVNGYHFKIGFGEEGIKAG